MAMHDRKRQLPWLSQRLSSATWATLGPMVLGGDNAVEDNAVGYSAVGYGAVEDSAIRANASGLTGFTPSPRDGDRAKVSSSGTSPAPDSPEPRLLAGPVCLAHRER